MNLVPITMTVLIALTALTAITLTVSDLRTALTGQPANR